MWAMHYEALRETRNFIMEHLSAMGLVPKIHDEIPEKIKKLAGEREEFRANQQFVQSDGLRKKINDLGYEIEDTPRGPFLWPSRRISND
jgi:cysteinyl-tRNA synthetase